MDATNLFDQFNTQDSYAILFIMLIAFLFGLLLGYILRSRRVRLLRQEVREREKQLAEIRVEQETLQETLALKEADLKKAGFATQEAEARAERLEKEKGELHRDIFQLNRKIEALEAAAAQAPAGDPEIIAELNAQIAQRDSEIEALSAQLLDLQQHLAGLNLQNQELSATLEQEGQSIDNLAQIQSIYNATRQRLEAMEAKLEHLAGENVALRQELTGLVQAGSRGLAAAAAPAAAPEDTPPLEFGPLHPRPDLPDAETVAEEPAVIFGADKKILHEKIILPEAAREADDLARIEGIGPFLERKLNEIGVFTYDEIAAWDSARIQEVTTAIQYFEGRIERDQWVEQAARLALRKQENPEAFRKNTSGPLSNDPQDLKVIEGIGLKIEELLKQAGISDWASLADADVEQLKAILDAAGPNFRIHDPGTWPSQARLAHNGDWAVLREYQEELKGGKLVD
jgi:predicted flap endonuclease-1-like 5' DNA nuclease